VTEEIDQLSARDLENQAIQVRVLPRGGFTNLLPAIMDMNEGLLKIDQTNKMIFYIYKKSFEDEKC